MSGTCASEAFGPEPLRILDVGDPFGTIAPLFPDDHTVSLDLYVDERRPAAAHHVLGSGFELPFADAPFDLVASHDTFEHLPAERGPTSSPSSSVFRAARRARRAVRGHRSRLCELMVNGYFVARLGHSIPALDEHEEFGLPSLSDAVLLDERGVAYAARATAGSTTGSRSTC